jgi:hypothetical protein
MLGQTAAWRWGGGEMQTAAQRKAPGSRVQVCAGGAREAVGEQKTQDVMEWAEVGEAGEDAGEEACVEKKLKC